MKKYYLHNGTEEQGPFSVEELGEKNLKKSTEIWYKGLPDWTTVGEVEELKDLFKLTTPPPIKHKATPPILKQVPPVLKEEQPILKEEKVQVQKKKTKNKKVIFFKLILACLAVFVGASGIYSFIQNTGRSSSYDSSSKSYKEQKMTIAETERSQPTRFLNASGTYQENFFGNKLKVNGTISNSATTVTYKDATVRVTYYSKTKTNLGSEDYTIWETFPPNHTKSFKLKVKNYSNVKSIGLDVISAKVY